MCGTPVGAHEPAVNGRPALRRAPSIAVALLALFPGFSAAEECAAERSPALEELGFYSAIRVQLHRLVPAPPRGFRLKTPVGRLAMPPATTCPGEPLTLVVVLDYEKIDGAAERQSALKAADRPLTAAQLAETEKANQELTQLSQAVVAANAAGRDQESARLAEGLSRALARQEALEAASHPVRGNPKLFRGARARVTLSFNSTREILCAAARPERRPPASLLLRSRGRECDVVDGTPLTAQLIMALGPWKWNPSEGNVASAVLNPALPRHRIQTAFLRIESDEAQLDELQATSRLEVLKGLLDAPP